MYYANVQYFKNRAAREKLAKIKKKIVLRVSLVYDAFLHFIFHP